MQYCMANSSVAFLDTELVYSTNPEASSAVAKSHSRRLEDGEAVPTVWDIDDHLLALRAWVSPLASLA